MCVLSKLWAFWRSKTECRTLYAFLSRCAVLWFVLEMSRNKFFWPDLCRIPLVGFTLWCWITHALSFVRVFRDGCRFLRSKPELLAALFALTSDPSIAVVKDCYHIFINLSADETLHQVISHPWSEKSGLNDLYLSAIDVCTVYVGVVSDTE